MWVLRICQRLSSKSGLPVGGSDDFNLPMPTEIAQPRATKLLINNRWVPSESGKTFATINPSTGEEICQVAEADAADVDKAVQAARRSL